MTVAAGNKIGDMFIIEDKLKIKLFVIAFSSICWWTCKQLMWNQRKNCNACSSNVDNEFIFPLFDTRQNYKSPQKCLEDKLNRISAALIPPMNITVLLSSSPTIMVSYTYSTTHRPEKYSNNQHCRQLNNILLPVSETKNMLHKDNVLLVQPFLTMMRIFTSAESWPLSIVDEAHRQYNNKLKQFLFIAVKLYNQFAKFTSFWKTITSKTIWWLHYY